MSVMMQTTFTKTLNMLSLACSVVLALFTEGLCLSVEDRACIAANNKSLSNDFLVGTWYEIYEIGTHYGMPRSELCRKQIFTKLNPQQVEFYKYIFKLLNMETELVNPVYVRDSRNNSYGVLSGATEGKMFSTDPRSLIWREENEEGRVYTYLDDTLAMWRVCERGFIRNFILSRTRNAEDEGVIKIINNISEFRNLGKHLRCLKKSDGVDKL